MAAVAAALSMVQVMAESTKIEIQGSVGKLAAVIQKPELQEGKKCPMVMLLHGFSGTKEGGLLEGIADALEKEGIASVRFDFNGHGESEGEFKDMTVLNEVEDAKLVYEYVSSLPYVGKIGVAGHSQGGVVASMLAGELGKSKIKCVVLLAPAAVLREDAIRGSTMGFTYDPLNPPEYVQMYGDLKLGRDYIQTAFDLPIYETAAGYKGPAFIIHGTADRIVPYSYGERYHDIWKKSELHVLEGFDHMFSQDLPGTVKLASDYLIKEMK